MKILVVSPNVPSPMSGASSRNYYMLKALAREHTVSLLALDDCRAEGVPSDTSLLEDLVGSMEVFACPKSLSKRWGQLMSVLRGRPYILDFYTLAEMQEAIDALLVSNCYETVFFESMLIAGYHLPQGVNMIIDEHNLEYELRQRTYQRERAWARKWYNWLDSRLIQAAEIEYCSRANAVLVTSEREQVTLKRLLPTSVIEVVPNGVDIEHFRAAGAEQEVEHRVVFTGTMDYYPNIDAVLFFARECWPRILAQVPTATWQIVGKNPPKVVRRLEEVAGVTVTGSVPDVRPYLAQAAVAIAPILIGSGTRLKILEAWAMGKAVVSTALGSEGLAVEGGKHLLVADEAVGLVQAIVELLRSPQQRQALGAAGRALVEAEYSWERSGRQLLQVLEKVC